MTGETKRFTTEITSKPIIAAAPASRSDGESRRGWWKMVASPGRQKSHGQKGALGLWEPRGPVSTRGSCDLLLE